jgi:hypothetical protein
MPHYVSDILVVDFTPIKSRICGHKIHTELRFDCMKIWGKYSCIRDILVRNADHVCVCIGDIERWLVDCSV